MNIKDTKEVESVLRVPALGLVPSRHALQGRRARRALAAADGAPFALLAHSEMASVFSEAFRNLPHEPALLRRPTIRRRRSWSPHRIPRTARPRW